MTLKVSLCALLLGASLATHAETRVHTVPAVQSLIPGGFFLRQFAGKGRNRWRLLHRDCERCQRPCSPTLAARCDRPMVRAGHLAGGTDDHAAQNDDVVMANGIAALRIGARLHIFERSGDSYVESALLGTPTGAPGMAISGRSILVARRGCRTTTLLSSRSLRTPANGASPARSAAPPANAMIMAPRSISTVTWRWYAIRPPRSASTGVMARPFAWVQVGTITPPPGATAHAGGADAQR